MSNDKMRESISDLRHSIVVDGYTEDQKDFLEALANRLEMIADGTFTQQPESEPIGYAQAYELELLAVSSVVHVGVLMGPKPEKGFTPIYTSSQTTPQVPDIGLLTRWELNLSQGGIDEDDCGQFVRFDDLEELLAAAPSIGEKNDG